MRFLGVGEHNDLGDLYRRLMARGHEVRVRVGDPDSRDVLAGMVPQSEGSLAEDLSWVGPRAEGGVVIFEGVGAGETQSLLREQGFAVVGGSTLGDRLELDRAYGQGILRDLGLPIAPTHELDGFDDALAFVRRTGRRYVLKFSGPGLASTRNYIGMLPNGEDMVARLMQQRRRWTFAEKPWIVLMDHVNGVEVGVGAWFDGHDFLKPANLDWEHKRFFPGDLGELTGEMGTVVSYDHADGLFDATLARLVPLLREARHVGYVNLNTIVNEAGVWPLELTCRFGYPGFAILGALHREPWDEFLKRLLDPQAQRIPTRPGFAVGVVLTVPPFPYPDGYDRLSKGVPVCFASDLTDDERGALHYGEVGLEDGQLVTAGQIGYAMVVTGCGPTVAEARRAAYVVAGKVAIPNLRYRNDIGARLESNDAAELQRLGWIP